MERKKNDNVEYKLRPMPEICLLDPVTGKLPRNYKDILKQNEKSKSMINVETNKKMENENDKFKYKLCPMPEINLLDPCTGKLPPNYNEILKSDKFAKPTSGASLIKGVTECEKQCTSAQDRRRRSKDSMFYISNNRCSYNASTSGHTIYDNKKSVRKVLFRNSRPKRSSLLRSSTNNTETNESALLDIEESEKLMFVPKKQGVPNGGKSRATPFKKVSNPKRNALDTSSSLEEFLKLEQQVKTPKSIIKQTQKNDITISKCISEIMIKFNENQNLYEELGANNKMINNNLCKIIEHLKATTEENNQNKACKKENVPPNLRVATLQSNLEKKVIFDLEKNERYSSLKKKSSPAEQTLTQTPNTMLKRVTSRADEQLLKLQDTPKHSQKRFNY